MGLIKFEDDNRLKSNDQPITENYIDNAVRDVFVNRTAISNNRYDNTIHALMGFPEGVPIIVEYYNKNISRANKQTANTSFSLERGAVQSSYMLIHNFEMRIDGELDVSQNSENGEMEVSGKAILYPGLNPRIGDIFLMTLENDQLGFFLVNDVGRLTIKQGSYHTISFYLYSFTTPDILDKITSSVIDEVYFDKEKYMTDNVTLLKKNSYLQLDKLKKSRNDLSELYLAEFYNHSENSLFITKNYSILKDGSLEPTPLMIYDPYLVEFIYNKINISLLKNPIKQLATEIIQYTKDNTILNLILHKNIPDLKFIYSNPCTYKFTIWNAYITSIANQICLYLFKDKSEIPDDYLLPLKKDNITIFTDPYIFSNKFYIALILGYHYDQSMIEIAIAEEQISQVELDLLLDALNNIDLDQRNDYLINNYQMNDYEIFVLNYLTIDSLISINDFITTYIDTYPYSSWSIEDRFYRIPIILHFIDLYIKSIV